MAGKFMWRAAVIDSVKSEHAANARRWDGLTRHPVRGYACGCPDPGCGSFYVIDTGRTIPIAAEYQGLLAVHNRDKKASR